MSITISLPQPERKFSVQMQTVLIILNADLYLKECIEPFINFETDSRFHHSCH